MRYKLSLVEKSLSESIDTQEVAHTMKSTLKFD